MTFVFSPPPTSSVAVAGSTDRFPVRRIFCVGRNYVAHAREMGKDPERDPPFFFTKPADAAFDAGPSDHAEIPYPPETKNFHYEIELTVAIGKEGRNVSSEGALGLVYGYAVSIDLTRRDLQLEAREQGRPWDWGKAFDLSAAMGAIHPVDAVGHPKNGRIWLSVDKTIKQDSDISKLIWPVADIIAVTSRSVTLRPGDLIMTGTPEGVGPIEPGQLVEGGIDGLSVISLRVGGPA